MSTRGQVATFGARLRRLRDAAGLTQEELAQRSGLTAKGISDLERGRRQHPYPHTVRSLADALGLSEEERGSLFAAVPKRGDAGPAAPSAVPEPTLPSPPTLLVGRERELAEVRDLLRRREMRLLTLTGTGGVGKTRLALEAARESADLFPDGVVFVALAPSNDPALVIPTVVRSLGLRESEGQTPREVLRAYLHEKRLLLLLDNFERLLEAAPEVAGLIESCPDLIVLVTNEPRLSSRPGRARVPRATPRTAFFYSLASPGRGCRVVLRPPIRGARQGGLPCLRALTPEERFSLDVGAMVRGDEEKSRKLTDTCPRHNYVMNDWGFVWRWQAARELAMLAYADLAKCLDKIHVIGAFRAMMPHLLTVWQDDTHAAYFDGHHAGSRHAWRLAGKGEEPPRWETDEEEASRNADRATEAEIEKWSGKVEEVDDRLAGALDELEGELAAQGLAVWSTFTQFCEEEMGSGADEGVVRIRRTLARSGGRTSSGEPKTRRSRRPVHLTGAAVEALRGHLERQLEDMERLGDLYRDHGLVFTSGVGTLINPTNLRRRSFAPLLQRAGLPQIRFHDLRHTCATLLLARNVHPKYVQELLGHATVAITLDTYSHVIPGMGNHTARAMEDVFS